MVAGRPNCNINPWRKASTFLKSSPDQRVDATVPKALSQKQLWKGSADVRVRFTGSEKEECEGFDGKPHAERPIKFLFIRPALYVKAPDSSWVFE